MKKNLTSLALLLISISALAQVPTDNLIFFAPFNGNATDSVSGSKGKVYGAKLRADRFGNLNSSYFFDGQNDYIDFGFVDPKNYNHFTLSIWIQLDSIFAREPGPTPDRTRKTPIGNADYRFIHHLDTLHFNVKPPQKRDLDFIVPRSYHMKWIHLVGISDSGDFRMYVDGKLVDELKNKKFGQSGSNINLEIGRDSKNEKKHWRGGIDDIRIYDDVLTQKEIQQLYSYKSPVYDTVTKTVYDTTNITVSDTVTVTIQDTNEVFVVDTIVVNDTLLVYDTIAVEDTLNIKYATSTNGIQQEVSLYPNPTSSVLNVQFKNYMNSNTESIKIYNSQGSEVWSSAVNNNSFQISLTNLGGAGIYFFRIYDSNNEEILNRKIVLK